MWRHWSGSTLAQVMACCLTAPNHHLNQCWLIINEILWHSTEGSLKRNAPDIYPFSLTYWCLAKHIWVDKLTIIGSDNSLSHGRRQAIIWTKDGILLIRPLGTNFNEILIKIHIFSFKKMHLKMSSGNWRPQLCLGLNVLILISHDHLMTMMSFKITN